MVRAWGVELVGNSWNLAGFRSVGRRVKAMWEFPKIGDLNIVPQIVGSLL